MSDSQPTTAYIALGSNLGDRAANIRAAAARLHDPPAMIVTKISSMLDNPAVGGPADSPAFLNAAAEVRTLLPPRALLDRLLMIERELGRIRAEKWGPRVIDLDLLLYGDMVIDEPDLHVPHPQMISRSFVLIPLAEIASEVVHPLARTTIQSLVSKV